MHRRLVVFIPHFFFQGTPMMLMGDEYGHTRYGNNNSYGHDSAINHFQWEQVISCHQFHSC